MQWDIISEGMKIFVDLYSLYECEITKSTRARFGAETPGCTPVIVVRGWYSQPREPTHEEFVLTGRIWRMAYTCYGGNEYVVGDPVEDQARVWTRYKFFVDQFMASV